MRPGSPPPLLQLASLDDDRSDVYVPESDSVDVEQPTELEKVDDQDDDGPDEEENGFVKGAV